MAGPVPVAEMAQLDHGVAGQFDALSGIRRPKPAEMVIVGQTKTS
jgi:hypothetical protein